MVKSIKLDVFGKIVLAIKEDGVWETFYLDSDGKRRKANEIQIPSFVDESDVESYLMDLCHEWASDNNTRANIPVNQWLCEIRDDKT